MNYTQYAVAEKIWQAIEILCSGMEETVAEQQMTTVCLLKFGEIQGG